MGHPEYMVVFYIELEPVVVRVYSQVKLNLLFLEYVGSFQTNIIKQFLQYSNERRVNTRLKIMYMFALWV